MIAFITLFTNVWSATLAKTFAAIRTLIWLDTILAVSFVAFVTIERRTGVFQTMIAGEFLQAVGWRIALFVEPEPPACSWAVLLTNTPWTNKWLAVQMLIVTGKWLVNNWKQLGEIIVYIMNTCRNVLYLVKKCSNSQIQFEFVFKVGHRLGNWIWHNEFPGVVTMLRRIGRTTVSVIRVSDAEWKYGHWRLLTRLRSICCKATDRHKVFKQRPVMLMHPASFSLLSLLTASMHTKMAPTLLSENLLARVSSSSKLSLDSLLRLSSSVNCWFALRSSMSSKSSTSHWIDLSWLPLALHSPKIAWLCEDIDDGDNIALLFADGRRCPNELFSHDNGGAVTTTASNATDVWGRNFDTVARASLCRSTMPDCPEKFSYAWYCYVLHRGSLWWWWWKMYGGDSVSVR